MTENEFNKIIKIIKDVDKTYEKLYKIGVLICDNPIFQHIQYLYDYVLKKEYGDEGYSWVMWYLFDLPNLKVKKNDNESYATDENGNPIIFNNDNDLYRFLETNYKNG